MIVALASGLYLSFLPDALMKHKRFTGAGLIGTLWGVAVLTVLPLDPVQQITVWAGFLLLSIAISDRAEELLGRHDDPRIVLDEVAGFLTAMLLLPRSPAVIAAAFVLFRLLDTVKPGWIRTAARLPGGWGVVMDDILAGFCANGLIRVALALFSS